MWFAVFVPEEFIDIMERKMSTKTNNKQTGFTLVELAIVLVIIGLVVSSVLVGQDLIKAAQLRATVRQLDEFQSAVGTFIGKYNGIPGDLNNGAKFGLTGTAGYQDGTTGDGDGSGVITQDNATTVLAFTGEMSTFWSHLTTSGKELISGSFKGDGCTAASVACAAGVDFPAMKFGANGWGVFGASNVNYFLAGVANPGSATALTVTSATFIPMDAYNIDSKIDDGVPTAGNVVSRGAHATVIDTAATTAASTSTSVCNNTSATIAAYQYTATTAQCTLRFQMATY